MPHSYSCTKSPVELTNRTREKSAVGELHICALPSLRMTLSLASLSRPPSDSTNELMTTTNSRFLKGTPIFSASRQLYQLLTLQRRIERMINTHHQLQPDGRSGHAAV